ncbi:MAG: exonuclease domain-containing protein, partial [Dysosmobacter welbionis]
SQNRRMSAVGVTLLDENGITVNFSFLVNPETHFDPFNISLTGITPAMVKNSPTFPQLWEELEELLSGRTLLAHNAPFDLGVLSKCLMDYGISCRCLICAPAA